MDPNESGAEKLRPEELKEGFDGWELYKK